MPHTTIEYDLSKEATEKRLDACISSMDEKDRYTKATCTATSDMGIYTLMTSSCFTDGAPVMKMFRRDGHNGTVLFRKGETFRIATYHENIAEDEGEATSFYWDARTQSWHEFDAIGHTSLEITYDRLGAPSEDEEGDEAIAIALSRLMP